MELLALISVCPVKPHSESKSTALNRWMGNFSRQLVRKAYHWLKNCVVGKKKSMEMLPSSSCPLLAIESALNCATERCQMRRRGMRAEKKSHALKWHVGQLNDWVIRCRSKSRWRNRETAHGRFLHTSETRFLVAPAQAAQQIKNPTSGIFAELNSCKSFENNVLIFCSYELKRASLCWELQMGKLSKSSEKKLQWKICVVSTRIYGFQIVCKDIPDFSGFRLNMLISPRASDYL